MIRKILAVFMVLAMLATCALAETYEGTGNGKNGELRVAVTVEDGKITAVEVLEHKDDAGISDPAIEKVPAAIVEHQSVAVDAATGATMTSNGIIEAVTNALTGAGLDIANYSAAVETAKSTEVIEETADIVVVGGGAAGMMAAMTAAEAGVDVLVIEKGATIGVANGWSCGGPMACNTSIQAEEGVTVTEEMLFNDLTDDAYLTSDSRLLRRVLARTGKAIDLQDSIGLDLYLRADNYGAGYRSRHGYNVSKPERGPIVTSAYEKLGGRLMTETAGQTLIVEDGKVVGITAVRGDGATVNIRAKAVLLATGGYLGNPEIIKEHWGDITVNPLGNTLSTGDAIRMGQEVGAMLEESSFAMISNEFGGSNQKGGGWQRSNGAMTIGIYGGLIVDGNGERFFNEYYMANQPLSVGGEAVLRAGKFYTVVDQAYVDAVASVGMFEYLGSPGDWYVGTMTAKGVVLDTLQADLDKAVEQGWAVKADTIEECAAFFGMEKLAETVERYNGYCAAGYDEEFFKNPTFLTAVDEGPFYVVEYEPSAWGTLGGLRTDSELRVLNSSLEPIEGLYAAGVDAGSLYCQPYYQVEGTAVGLAFGSGILAAETMMADIAE